MKICEKYGQAPKSPRQRIQEKSTMFGAAPLTPITLGSNLKNHM